LIYGAHDHIIESHHDGASSALRVSAAPRVIDQCATHDLRTEREKVNPVHALDSACTNQFQIRFIGQSGGLQTSFSGVSAQLPTRDAAHFRIEEGNDAIKRIVVAATPCG
jgi:hypothetical protein